jgi:predicted ATP-binding protein involved in virulence
MRDVFITKIHIAKVRHLENVDIVLSDTERKHLILTGKNGSGKTSLLEAMRNGVIAKQQIPADIDNSIQWVNIALNESVNPPQLDISYSAPIKNFTDVTFVYISTKRNEPVIPKAVESVNITGKNFISCNAREEFFKYILNLYVQYLSAKDSAGTTEEIARYSKWFDNFTSALRDIYDCQELELKPDMKNLVFKVVLPGHEPFNLHEMSDGYAAFIDIYMELLMRLVSSDAVVDFEKSAIVLIDEIETHLHVELQKRALPFLTKAFPNIQFIVATHSPFVITSLEKAIVYDLEKHVRLDGDLTEYSYSDIVEGYYDVSECSACLESDFNRYVELCSRDSRTAAEREETRKLFERLNKIPGTSPLSTAFYMFERRRGNGKDN